MSTLAERIEKVIGEHREHYDLDCREHFGCICRAIEVPEGDMDAGEELYAAHLSAATMQEVKAWAEEERRELIGIDGHRVDAILIERIGGGA